MIIQLAEKVSNQVVELEQRKQGAMVNQFMQDTDSSLLELRKRVDKLTNFIQFNKNRIKGNDRERLVVGLANIQETLKSSQNQFHQVRRQVPMLHNIGTSVDTEFKNAKTAWLTFFREEMGPIFQATNLASKLLPNSDQKNIQVLQEQIKGFFSSPPLTSNDMIHMAELVLRLRNYTQSGIAKYSPSVGKFLEKVQNENATLADLNDEVYAWIKEQGIQEKFIIIFAK